MNPMKRKEILSGIATAGLILCAGIMVYSLCCRILPFYLGAAKEKKYFQTFEADFEAFKDLILSADLNLEENEEKIFSIVYDENKVITGLHNFPRELQQEDLDSLNRIHEIFTYSFNCISVTKNRISFGGDGYQMIVYSVNRGLPQYFYGENDGVHFWTARLSRRWYYLFMELHYFV